MVRTTDALNLWAKFSVVSIAAFYKEMREMAVVLLGI